MLYSREYKPNSDELIYHYCDSKTFHAICSNKTLRFSDVYSMNDFLEMHWGYSIWEKAASELLNTIDKAFLDKVDEMFQTSNANGLPLTSCFSLEGDLLSQWRAYAHNGEGYSIGFCAKDLVQLPVRPLRVLYEEAEQISELIKIVKAIYEIEQTEEIKFGKEFISACFAILMDTCSLKNSAFSEEKEVRLLHVLNFEKSNSFLKLIDSGGTSYGKKVKGLPVQFVMRENLPVPFIDLDFTNNGKVNPIKEVIIGPRNYSRSMAVSVFLETLNIGSVKIKRSKASYR